MRLHSREERRWTINHIAVEPKITRINIDDEYTTLAPGEVYKRAASFDHSASAAAFGVDAATLNLAGGGLCFLA